MRNGEWHASILCLVLTASEEFQRGPTFFSKPSGKYQERDRADCSKYSPATIVQPIYLHIWQLWNFLFLLLCFLLILVFPPSPPFYKFTTVTRCHPSSATVLLCWKERMDKSELRRTQKPRSRFSWQTWAPFPLAPVRFKNVSDILEVSLVYQHREKPPRRYHGQDWVVFRVFFELGHRLVCLSYPWHRRMKA